MISISKITSSISVSNVSQISATATGFATSSINAFGLISLGVGASGFATTESNAYGDVTLGAGFIGGATSISTADGTVTTNVNVSEFATSTFNADGAITFTPSPSDPVLDTENIESTLTTATIPYTADAGTTQEYRLNGGDITSTTSNPIVLNEQPGSYVYEMRSVDGNLFSFWVEQIIVLPDLEEDETTTEQFSTTV